MPPVGFEPTISAGELPNTHALDRAATGTGTKQLFVFKIQVFDFIFPGATTTIGGCILQPSSGL